MQKTDRFWNQYENSLEFLDKLMGQYNEMYWKQSLEIKVFQSLFIQIIDGLNFGLIYDDYVAIWKCLSKSRRIFLKPRFLLVFRGNRVGISCRQESFGGAKETYLGGYL